MAGKPVLILSARHRPIEVTVLIAFLLTGVFGLFSPARTVQQLDVLMRGFGWVWYVGISVGALIALISVVRPIPDALIWERIGLVTISTFLVGYSFASIMFLGFMGLRGTLILLLFALGSVLRSVQITRDLRLLERIVEETKE